MNRKGQATAFFLGMLIFFYAGGFEFVALWHSFTSSDALGVFLNFFLALALNGLALLGLTLAADGFSD